MVVVLIPSCVHPSAAHSPVCGIGQWRASHVQPAQAGPEREVRALACQTDLSFGLREEVACQTSDDEAGGDGGEEEDGPDTLAPPGCRTTA